MIEMAKVNVRFFTMLRELAGVAQIEVHCDTIAGMIEKITEKYGSIFRDTLLDKGSGQIKSLYCVLVNGARLDLPEGLNQELKDGDVIAILPPVGGGR